MQTEEQLGWQGKKIRTMGKYQMLKHIYSPLEHQEKKKVTKVSQVTMAKNFSNLIADINI